MAIITIIRPAIMLNVNRMSKAIDGSGITSIAIMARITNGMAIPFASVKLNECRKSDTNELFIIPLKISYLKIIFKANVNNPLRLSS